MVSHVKISSVLLILFPPCFSVSLSSVVVLFANQNWIWTRCLFAESVNAVTEIWQPNTLFKVQPALNICYCLFFSSISLDCLQIEFSEFFRIFFLFDLSSSKYAPARHFVIRIYEQKCVCYYLFIYLLPSKVECEVIAKMRKKNWTETHLLLLLSMNM